MSRKIIRSSEMLDRRETLQEQSEEAKALRKKQLEEALSHQNKIELEIEKSAVRELN